MSIRLMRTGIPRLALRKAAPSMQQFQKCFSRLERPSRRSDFPLRKEAIATPTDRTDIQWEKIQPLLPPPKGMGRPRADDRTTWNGILFVLRTGCRWQDLPERYGAAVTCWPRLKQWEEPGVWEKVWRTLLRELDEQQKLDGSRAFLDGCFAPAKKGGSEVGLPKRGKGSKRMVVTDGNRLPLAVLVDSANEAEIHLAEDTLATISVPQRRGRPKTQPRELVGDQA